MDSLRSSPSTDYPTTDGLNDLSTVSWIADELRRSLEQALKALRRQLKESESSDSDVDAIEPAILSGARQNLHQCVGAAEMVGLHGASVVLKACETAVVRFIGKPKLLDATAIAVIEGASFALLDYISRLLAGKQVSALSMFPQYRAVQAVAGADRVHPADLWGREWHWQPLPTDERAEARRELVEQPRARRKLLDRALVAGVEEEDGRAAAVGARGRRAQRRGVDEAALAERRGRLHVKVVDRAVEPDLLARRHGGDAGAERQRERELWFGRRHLCDGRAR
jgi:chemosensory pili system protein ChpA (sensor histidine kinase/response regulator)